MTIHLLVWPCHPYPFDFWATKRKRLFVYQVSLVAFNLSQICTSKHVFISSYIFHLMNRSSLLELSLNSLDLYLQYEYSILRFLHSYLLPFFLLFSLMSQQPVCMYVIIACSPSNQCSWSIIDYQLWLIVLDCLMWWNGLLSSLIFHWYTTTLYAFMFHVNGSLWKQNSLARFLFDLLF